MRSSSITPACVADAVGAAGAVGVADAAGGTVITRSRARWSGRGRSAVHTPSSAVTRRPCGTPTRCCSRARPATSRVISRGALAPPMVGLATRLSLLLRPRQFCPSVTALFWCADFCGFGRFALRRCQRTCEAPLLLSCRAAWLRSKLAHRRVSVQWLGALLPIAHVLAVARDHRRGLMPLVAMTFQSTLGCGGRSASLSRGGLAARAWP